MKPKHLLTALLAIAALATAPVIRAAETADKKEHADHDHDNEKKGPNGGILIHSVEPHIELIVTKDRKAKILFIGDDNKPVASAEQTVTAIGGDRANPTRLTFAKGEGDDANALISDKPLPDGDHVQLVLQIKTTPEAKPVTERLTLHLH